MHLKNKPPMSCTVSREAWRALDGISKAALIDLYVQALATARGECDSEVPLDAIADDVRPMLEMRGDAIPHVFRRG